LETTDGCAGDKPAVPRPPGGGGIEQNLRKGDHANSIIVQRTNLFSEMTGASEIPLKTASARSRELSEQRATSPNEST
jgi:hypothetical protein